MGKLFRERLYARTVEYLTKKTTKTKNTKTERSQFWARRVFGFIIITICMSVPLARHSSRFTS